MTKKNEQLATLDPETALVDTADDLIQYEGAGTENITSDDVRPPRLIVCQGQTPQRKKGTPEYIPGLEEPALFNSLTGQIYGEGPLALIIIKRLKPRAMVFDNLTSQVLEFDVPLTDPRLQFTTGTDGKRVKPTATLFKEYLVFLPETLEVVVLSCKGASLSVATTIDSLLKLPVKVGDKLIANPPAWTRLFTLTSAMDSDNAGHDFSAIQIHSAGITPPHFREFAAKTFLSLQNKTIIVEADTTPEVDDENVPF